MNVNDRNPRFPGFGGLHSPLKDKNEKPFERGMGALVNKDKFESLEEQIKNNPELEKLFNKVTNNLVNQSPETQFSINRIVVLLIALCRALQDASVVMANRLEKITERLTGYSTQLTQVPVVLKGQASFQKSIGDEKEDLKIDADSRGLANQKFANMLEAVRANKGLDEDKAKKIQTIMQSMKDASASSSDFITSFIDLLRGVNSKIFR